MPVFVDLLYHIRSMKDTESKSAEMYGKMTVFLNKWLPLIEMFKIT